MEWTTLKLEILRMYNDDDDEGKDLSDLRNPLRRRSSIGEDDLEMLDFGSRSSR
ncbi:unnamed protein product [Brassica oleracea var. botrytis]